MLRALLRFAVPLLLLGASGAAAAPLPVQRYVSLRTGKAYLRQGPSYAHHVLWVYRHKGYPFAVTASFDIWRRLRAADGTVGWMSVQMLSDRRTVLITADGRSPIRAAPGPRARLVGLAEKGAIAEVKACRRDACEIAGDGIKGWIDKSRIWGVGRDETFR
jgi:SH3-like domain-containing protein